MSISREEKYTTTLFISSIGIFLYGLYIHDLNTIILHLLEFIVIFEIVRAFIHYIKAGSFKVRYMIDGSIFYAIKELYIGFVEYKIHATDGLLIISLQSIAVLMILRAMNIIITYYFCGESKRCNNSIEAND